ncbi:MAG TPA: murein biosynthesis integral membrane protein MurJ [Pelolinea sp.]|nr:murein biosynthesis integral membrane protein MurJ [Pelolinea sp.]
MAGMQTEPVLSTRANTQIARAAGTVMVAFVVSNLVGLFAKTLTARIFGTGIESNAFFAANRFSEILFNLVAGGALGSAFIPVFTGLLAKDERQKAWKLASAIANLISLVLVIFSLLSILFSRQVVHFILAPGFTGEEMILTAQLLRIQVLSSVVFGMSGLVMGVLNSHQRFLLPALAPAMYQVGWIIGLLLLSPAMGIFSLAWGVVIGSVLHLLVQLPMLLRLPKRAYWPSFGLGIPEVREVGRLMAPRLLGVAVVQLNFLINTLLASFQPEGSITAISLAFPLMIMPEAAIAQSIAIAALPTFAAQVAKGQIFEMQSSLSATLRVTLLLSIPAMIGLILLREPIVTLLYQGREFTAQSTQLVAWALLFYAMGLVGHSLVEVTSRAFYALHDTRTPVAVGVGAMTLNLAFSFLFTILFNRIGWMPHGGLALANTAATLLESILLLALMRRRLNGLEESRILVALMKALIAGAVMGLLIWQIYDFMDGYSLIGRTATSILAGILSFGILLVIFRTDEVARLNNMFFKK